MKLTHIYEVRPRKNKRGVDLISDVLPFGRLWYGEPDGVSNAIGYAKFRSRSHDAVIRVYDEQRDRSCRRYLVAAVKGTRAAFRAHVSPVSVLAPSTGAVL